jgi:DNA-binding NarL/FixJ family response regulator
MTKANILIVEYESHFAMGIQNTLENYGYVVTGYMGNAEDAINKVEKLHPDLIMVDINLKGEMDGIEIATQIRSRFDLPVVFLTACVDQFAIERACQAEPYGYLHKGFEECELVATIELPSTNTISTRNCVRVKSDMSLQYALRMMAFGIGI